MVFLPTLNLNPLEICGTIQLEPLLGLWFIHQSNVNHIGFRIPILHPNNIAVFFFFFHFFFHFLVNFQHTETEALALALPSQPPHLVERIICQVRSTSRFH